MSIHNYYCLAENNYMEQFQSNFDQNNYKNNSNYM